MWRVPLMEKKQGFQLGNPLGLWPSIEEIPFAFDLAIVSKEWKGAGLTTVKPVQVLRKYIRREILVRPLLQ